MHIYMYIYTYMHLYVYLDIYCIVDKQYMVYISSLNSGDIYCICYIYIYFIHIYKNWTQNIQKQKIRICVEKNTVISVLFMLALRGISRSVGLLPNLSFEISFEKPFPLTFSHSTTVSLFHDRRCLSVIFWSDDRQYLTCPVQNCKVMNNFFHEPSLAFPFLSPSTASISNDSATSYTSISSP